MTQRSSDQRALTWSGGGVGRDIHCGPLEKRSRVLLAEEKRLHFTQHRFVTTAGCNHKCRTLGRVLVQGTLMNAFDRRPMVHRCLSHAGLLETGT